VTQFVKSLIFADHFSASATAIGSLYVCVSVPTVTCGRNDFRSW